MTDAMRTGVAEKSTKISVAERSKKIELAADALAVAVAVALPWSVTATAILLTAWLVAFLATVDLATLRRALAHPAAALPVAFCALAAIGMFWADAVWSERLSEFKTYLRLLIIPLLLVQFQRSDRGVWVLSGFAASCTVLLALSWLQWLLPSLTFRDKQPGVPVKDHIIQSGEFLICAFGLAHLSFEAWIRQRRWSAVLLALLALLFITNIAFVAAARSVVLIFGVFVILFGFQRFGLKGALATVLVATAFAWAAWTSSTYLRVRVVGVLSEVQAYQTRKAETSAGYRLEFWRKSADIISRAPILGHGTGSLYEQSRRAAESEKGEGITSVVTNNPHNQTLVVAIQLGLIGVALLYAMWGSHLMMFRGSGLIAWVGAAVVAHNIGAGLFNSQLFEATLGWMYIFAVGVMGGMILRQQSA